MKNIADYTLKELRDICENSECENCHIRKGCIVLFKDPPANWEDPVLYPEVKNEVEEKQMVILKTIEPPFYSIGILRNFFENGIMDIQTCRGSQKIIHVLSDKTIENSTDILYDIVPYNEEVFEKMIWIDKSYCDAMMNIEKFCHEETDRLFPPKSKKKGF